MNSNRQTPRQSSTPGSTTRRPQSASSAKSRSSPHNNTAMSRRLIPPSNSDDASSSGSSGVSELVDYNLELKFAYNDYLQSLMKANIVEETTSRHIQDYKDQLPIESEKMHTFEEDISKLQADLSSSQVIEATEENLENLQGAVLGVKKCLTEYNLKEMLKNLKTVLEQENRKLHLKNVKPLKTQAELDQFNELIEKITSSSEQLQKSHDIDEVEDLIEEFQHCQETANSTVNNSESLLEQENNFTRDMMSTLSDKMKSSSDDSMEPRASGDRTA